VKSNADWLIRGGLGLAAVLSVACGPSVDRPDGFMIVVDGGHCEPARTPNVAAVPDEQPYGIATIRGSSPQSLRIIIMGDANRAIDVLPDGTFCADIELPGPGTYNLEVFAQNDCGELSAVPAMVTVVYNESAAPVPGAMTCTGADPAGCTGTTEICDNGRDDNCDSRVDGADPMCSSCPDDGFEDNDGPTSPRVEPRTYDNLKICPDDEDWFGVSKPAGSRISARINYTQSAGDLDLMLLDTDGRTIVTFSNTGDGVEHVATTDAELATMGVYWVRVYGYMHAGNTYSLTITVGTP